MQNAAKIKKLFKKIQEIPQIEPSFIRAKMVQYIK